MEHNKHPLEPSSRRTSTTAAGSSDNHGNANTSHNDSINSSHLDPDHAAHRSSSESYHPPFLVRSRSQAEKERMQRQLEQQKRTKSPYDTLRRVYERYSTSALLENKAAVARDHLANERTFLAWLRTSLSLVTVGVAITQLYKLSPDGVHAHSGRAIGATFVVLSIVFLYMANARYFHSQVALTKDRFPASRGAVLFGSTAVLAILIAMFVVIILDQKSS
ncbi:hypothetical protein RO3G_14150 [Lichtheimia corymbifera JMRC:FSU:9682]|uniref:DUF202 domain-containing protein n=1 Tax=Lichtheimia corymbifera JMRC:FSU:9682 TaxID=1263082 RepID=A0A068RU35_9FUNG|nr:hypothetical protein RO3G_14150 [Lichtheimia corymbifera JMRC:FSU:9682]